MPSQLGAAMPCVSLVIFAPLLLCAVGAAGDGTCDAASRGLIEVPCERGVYDCAYCNIPKKAKATTCASYDDKHVDPQGQVWVVVVGGIIAALMAFGIGGNDAANSWGTSVGCGAISLIHATMLGGLAEFLGATFLGAGVSGTIQKGVARLGDENCWACGFCDSTMAMYQFGMFSALTGAAVFLLLVTFVSLPVSTTHSIVGGVVGMTVTAIGWPCLNWSMKGLTGIVLSWVISPVFSGLVGVIMYLVTYAVVFKARDPVRRAYVSVPVLYGLTGAVVLFLILKKASVTKKVLSDSTRLIICGIVLVIAPVLVYFTLLPRVRRQVEQLEASFEKKPTSVNSELSESQASQPASSEQQEGEEDSSQSLPAPAASSEALAAADAMPTPKKLPFGEGMALFTQSEPTKEQYLARKTFQLLLVFTAFLESLAHGANDTANATGPYGALVSTYQNGIYACKGQYTPWWILMIAGAFVALGINTLGCRVIKTMGERITEVDYHMAFCVEFSSAFSVIIATFMNMPVSTTHCQVGAVVFVGFVANGPRNVSWPMFGKIFASWIITLPMAGGLAAFMVWLRFMV